MRKIKMDLILWILDFLLAAAMVLGVWCCNYLVPGAENVKIQERPHAKLSSEAAFRNVNADPGQLDSTARDWHEKFADRFTDTVITTENSYTSPNLSVMVTHSTYDTGRLDPTESGKHRKYGMKVSYTLADIYMGDISCFQTAFAQDTYGVGYTERLGDMADRIGSVLAVNGDSYSNNRHRDNGTIIRNGMVYRTEATDAETCVLFRDGTMKTYSPGEIDPECLAEEDGCAV